MEPLKLSDIIGQEIAGVRFHYIPADDDAEYSVPLFYTYIKLANNRIIGIPHFENAHFETSQESFENGKEISHWSKFLIGQKIVDFFFCYFDNEPDYGRSSYIKLSNDYYFTERTYEFCTFRLFDEQQFLQEMNNLTKEDIDIRSFLKNKSVS